MSAEEVVGLVLALALAAYLVVALVKKIKTGGVFSKTRMESGFIITSVNGMDISSIEDLNEAIKSLKGETIQLEGMYPGYSGTYRYPLNMNQP